MAAVYMTTGQLLSTRKVFKSSFERVLSRMNDLLPICFPSLTYNSLLKMEICLFLSLISYLSFSLQKMNCIEFAMKMHYLVRTVIKRFASYEEF